MEYNPAPCQDTDFSVDLTTRNTNGPKNTARWRLTIDPAIFAAGRFCDTTSPPNFFDPLETSDPDQTLTVQTRIYDWVPMIMGTTVPVVPEAIGTSPAGAWSVYVQPENFSETYCWWTDSADDVPMTERSQFLGDPRHNPYSDLLDGDPDFPNHYNWYFDDLEGHGGDARNAFPGLARVTDRWNGIRLDVPRYFELIRTALSRSGAVYTTLTGYSYYYAGIGNEIGYDSANGYPASIPTYMGPWGSTGSGHVNNITGNRTLINDTVAGGDWMGLTWLNELYPDYAYPVWSFVNIFAGDVSPLGNLPAGTSLLQFVRRNEQNAYVGSRYQSHGATLTDSQHRTGPPGCVSFFNNGDSSSHFNHHSTSGDGALTTVGQEIADNYAFPIPSTTPITRPFSLDTGGNVPPEFEQPEYENNRFSAVLREEFYEKGAYYGSGLVELTAPNGTDSAFIVVNGLAQTTQSSTSFIAKYCLLSMLQSFFELGDPSLATRIKQPPRVELLSPTEITELKNPAKVEVQFGVDWVRWDGQSYTNTTAMAFLEAEDELEYVLTYSRDNGLTWLYCFDDAPAEIGVYPTNPLYRLLDAGAGDEAYTWSTPPADFPDGTYIVRVEAYRQNQALHYSHHMSRIYIQR